MNTGQTLLVVGAFSLLSTVAGSVARAVMEGDRSLVEAQAGTIAVFVAQEKIDDFISTPFDSLAVGAWTDTLYTTFAAFVCSTRVAYVQDTSPDSAVGGPTSFKRMSVAVRSRFAPETVVLRGISADY